MNTPIEFHVTDSLFDDDESCLLLGGAVQAGASIEAGMKVSVAISRSLAMEWDERFLVPAPFSTIH